MTLLDEIRARCSQTVLDSRDDAAIATAVSQGRTRLQSITVSERGVRSALSIVDGASFIKLLRDLSAATTAPAWVTGVCDALGIPASIRWAYLDTLQCAYPWLQREGLDVGAKTTRDMLDLIAAGNPPLAAACQAIKALAEVADPIDPYTVRRAVWSDTGEWLP